jgi:hypothetical protein
VFFRSRSDGYYLGFWGLRLLIWLHGEGLLDEFVESYLHLRGPSIPVIGILKPLFRASGNIRFQLPGFHSCKEPSKITKNRALLKLGGPNGNRTRVLALRGPRPRPLDDGTVYRNCKSENGQGFQTFSLINPSLFVMPVSMAGERGFEPL